MRWPWPERLLRCGIFAATDSSCCCGSRLPFYALSIAYGSVPIYLPVWYPFSYYNVRYGLELLPVFAVFLAVLADFILQGRADQRRASRVAVIVIGLVMGSYVSIYRQTPITLREAQANSAAALLWSELWQIP